MQRVDHPEPAAANAQALHDLQNGATGLVLVFAGSVSANGFGLDPSPATLDRALDGVDLTAVAIDLNLSPATRHVVRDFAALVKSRGLAPIKGRSARQHQSGWRLCRFRPRAANLAELAPSFAAMVGELAGSGFRGPFAVADGRIIHNAGGSEAHELAFALASAVAYLRALETAGMALAAAREAIYFRLSADADQFLTMAKFRAARKLWARVEQACALTPKPVMIAAETAWRMMTQRDPHVNMLRTTIAVAAAGFGGADAITVLPHTAPLGLPDAIRPPHRAQHSACAAGGIEPRPRRRSGRRLRRTGSHDARSSAPRRGRPSARSSRPAACGRRWKPASFNGMPRRCAPSANARSRAATTC